MKVKEKKKKHKLVPCAFLRKQHHQFVYRVSIFESLQSSWFLPWVSFKFQCLRKKRHNKMFQKWICYDIF